MKYLKLLLIVGLISFISVSIFSIMTEIKKSNESKYALSKTQKEFDVALEIIINEEK